MSDMLGESTAKTRTRFVVGLGPKSSNAEAMEKLILAGASVFRNNFAHAQYEEYKERVAILKQLNDKLGTDVKMQADLQGQNIRVGMLPNEEVELFEGHSYTFVTNGGELADGEIPINDDNLHNDVKADEPISFADGAIEGIITNVDGHKITVAMTNSGILKQRKSINVPATDLTASSLTEKDLQDLDFLLETGVDIVAVSFIAGREELDRVRGIIAEKGQEGKVVILSKIERQKAIENLREIIDASDGVMIARGDLGIELPMEEIPILQKEIINLCHQQYKPVITATQMLLSMTHSIRPTRAEVSDVANAVFDQSDALMLSEETMVGIHPDHTLATMVKIARRIEQYMYDRPNYFERFGF